MSTWPRSPNAARNVSSGQVCALTTTERRFKGLDRACLREHQLLARPPPTRGQQAAQRLGVVLGELGGDKCIPAEGPFDGRELWTGPRPPEFITWSDTGQPPVVARGRVKKGASPTCRSSSGNRGSTAGGKRRRGCGSGRGGAAGGPCSRPERGKDRAGLGGARVKRLCHSLRTSSQMMHRHAPHTVRGVVASPEEVSPMRGRLPPLGQDRGYRANRRWKVKYIRF